MERKFHLMAGLNQSSGHRRPKRSRKPRERDVKHVSPDPGTSHTDLGLGRRLADPDAPATWRFTIRRLGTIRRTGITTCTTYVDANDAAGDVLGEYFERTGTPLEGRKVFSCEVTGEGPNAGETGGAEGRDWT